MDNILLQFAAAIVSSLASNFLGQRILANSQTEKKTPIAISIRFSSLLLGVIVFFLWKWTGHTFESPTEQATPILQSVLAKPNFVAKGGIVTVTVQLDRPAPRGGASVVLTSSDPAILTVDGNAIVDEGKTMGTGYSRAVNLPTYLSPIRIVATYNNSKVQTEVNVTKAALSDQPTPSTQIHSKNTMASLAPTATPTMTPLPPRPAPLDAELVGRLEEAEGRLSGEKNYWQGVKQHMPVGTSLRSEITSQLFAAESSAQRCDKEKQAADATSLPSCIDALNDHLTQLTIQH